MVVKVLAGIPGHTNSATRVALKYLNWVVQRYEDTGTVWEKYVALPQEDEPAERYDTVKFYGWSCASVVDLGRQVGFGKM
jgi:hypothetical protein